MDTKGQTPVSSGGRDPGTAALRHEALLKGHIPGGQSRVGNERGAKRWYQQVDRLEAQLTSRCHLVKDEVSTLKDCGGQQQLHRYSGRKK